MRKKKIILLACLLAFLTAGRACAQTLVIHHGDGTSTDVELYLMPRIQFDNDKVLITSPVLNLEYPRDDVRRFTYKGGTLKVEQPAMPGDAYSLQDGQLVFHGVSDAARVALYTAGGIRIPVRLNVSGDSLSLPLASIPSGVYVISVNNRTSKITIP